MNCIFKGKKSVSWKWKLPFRTRTWYNARTLTAAQSQIYLLIVREPQKCPWLFVRSFNSMQMIVGLIKMSCRLGLLRQQTAFCCCWNQPKICCCKRVGIYRDSYFSTNKSLILWMYLFSKKTRVRCVCVFLLNICNEWE